MDLPQTSSFIGREKELADIDQKLHNDSLKHIVVLHGLSGIGKTQLAARYVMEHRSEYTAVFWLDASDPRTLGSSFLNMAYRIALDHTSEDNLKNIIDCQNSPAQQLSKQFKRLKDDMQTSSLISLIDKIKHMPYFKGDEIAPTSHEEKMEVDQDNPVVEAMKMWLSQPGNNRWLLVYDNYDAEKYSSLQAEDLVTLRSFLPDALQGHVIVTTISKLRFGDMVHVQKMDSQQGLRIISSASGRSDLEEGAQFYPSPL